MGIKSVASSVTSNDALKGLTFLPALEGVNTLVGQLAGYKAQLGTIMGTTKETIDYVLNTAGVNNLLNANPALSSGLLSAGAGLLSNKVLRDLGLYEEGKTIGSMKNLARYGLNAGAMLATYSAGTAAAPYLLGGTIAYYAGKHGWKYSGKALKGFGGLLGRLGKGVANVGVGAGNGLVHTITDTFSGLYDGVIGNKLAKPTLKPAYVTNN